jgi:hypothetical protein
VLPRLCVIWCSLGQQCEGCCWVDLKSLRSVSSRFSSFLYSEAA